MKGVTMIKNITAILVSLLVIFPAVIAASTVTRSITGTTVTFNADVMGLERSIILTETLPAGLNVTSMSPECGLSSNKTYLSCIDIVLGGLTDKSYYYTVTGALGQYIVSGVYKFETGDVAVISGDNIIQIGCINGQTQQCGIDTGECAFGIQTCSQGAWSACAGSINPADETCDGKDNDCDSMIDEGFPDNDSDGIKDCADNDDDNDGVNDSVDNCIIISNPGQQNNDSDAFGDACDNDDDNDGVNDNIDNCVFTPNQNQFDSDLDGMGDACDNDDDNDSINDAQDNCPLVSNPGQEDNDLDGAGDACDNDEDNDGIPDNEDNCQAMFNPAQEDNDNDGLGDVCDSDDDNDGIVDNEDNCDFTANPNQADSDSDGIGDACDTCSNDQNNDADHDGICGNMDNCPLIANSNQQDNDGDGIGNACDICINDASNDIDNDAVCGNIDNCPTVANPTQSDTDSDGVGDSCDQYPDDNDNDGYPTDIDCNDNNPTIHPGAPEILDNIDQNCVNDAPVLNPISDISEAEGTLVKIIPSAYDVDGDALSFSFTAPLDSTGKWQTGFSDSGAYTTTVSVSDNRGGSDSKLVHITITEFGNHAPVLEHIDNIVVKEEDKIVIAPKASDLDGDTLTITISGPIGDDGVWQTKKGDKGKYYVTVSVSDGETTTSQQVIITVGEKAAQELSIPRIRLSDDYVRAGESLRIFVTVDNTGNIDIKDAKVTAVIDEFGIRERVGPFKVADGDEVTKQLEIDIPENAEKGTYNIRITVSTDKVRRVKYRAVEII